MAAGHSGKVPGAPPRNPTDARSREARRGKKLEKSTLNYCEVREWKLRADTHYEIYACGLLPLYNQRGKTLKIPLHVIYFNTIPPPRYINLNQYSIVLALVARALIIYYGVKVEQ